MVSSDPGILSLLPTILVFSLAVWTRRPIESLLCGSLLGLVMLFGSGFVTGMAEASIVVLTDPDVAWVILVCGLMGGLIALLMRSGASGAFTAFISTRVKDEKRALFATWLLGIAMFVDDYLNSLAVGAAMRDVTDKFKISREKLAYVVDSTAAPISVIIPYSTWGAFFAGLLVANGLAEDGEGLDVYISAIPYMFYAWAAVLVVPLVIGGWIPSLGSMRAADERARSTGVTVPPEAQHIENANRAIAPKAGVRPRLWLFLVPMICLVGATIAADNDFLVGIYITLGATLVVVLGMRILDLHDAFDTVLDGFKTMIEPLAVLVAAFILKEVNDDLGMATYVVASLEPLLTAQILPFAVFLSMGLVSFLTGSNWGVFVIILPIVVALGNSVDADMTLLIGATLSASTFGSHACFYSDATVLTAQATGCTPMQHALTQLPFALIAAAIAAVGYLAVGYAI
ncbi:Na+/H+ antiporter NhaC family protein [Congregibacter litoralis]|uniref:Transporter, NhaC family n=1 Tax=Congregibacter litoralis KT71 TaxID=314285 RepID=A4A8D9_9GAMM|nr:Na+/H+ antiporter NhaC family protein [Congregibacter litoralis]EAQ97934.1 transporter, NhaC family [Congregibacter litoralis KT71]